MQNENERIYSSHTIFHFDLFRSFTRAVFSRFFFVFFSRCSTSKWNCVCIRCFGKISICWWQPNWKRRRHSHAFYPSLIPKHRRRRQTKSWTEHTETARQQPEPHTRYVPLLSTLRIPFHADMYETALPTETVAPVAIFGTALPVIVRTTIDCRLDTHRHPKLFQHHCPELPLPSPPPPPSSSSILPMKVDDFASCSCDARTLLQSGKNCHSRHTDRLENLCVHVRPLKHNARVHTIYASLFISHTYPILSTTDTSPSAGSAMLRDAYNTVCTPSRTLRVSVFNESTGMMMVLCLQK